MQLGKNYYDTETHFNDALIHSKLAELQLNLKVESNLSAL